MKGNETIEEWMLRLQREYDDRGKIVNGIKGDQPAISVEFNDKWFARMTNGGSVRYVFYKSGRSEIYRKAVASGANLIEALNNLENLCIEMRKKKAVLIDPTSVEWE